MAKFLRLEVLTEIVRIGVVPVFYHQDFETARSIVEACAAGGARVIEFTNRGDNAYRVFSDLVMHFSKADPSIILGVGSVLDPATGALYLSSGANFVVGSVLNSDLARVCNRRKVSYSPGCGSASEISEAEELGVEIIKIFPGDSVGGPNFVRSILGPTPWTRIMPTGGVEATRESLQAWFKAGVAAVGIGSNLVKKEWVNSGKTAEITALAQKAIRWAGEARNQPTFIEIEHVGLYGTDRVSGRDIAAWYQDLFGFDQCEGRSSIFVGGIRSGSIEVMKEGESDRCHIAIRVSDFEAAMDQLRIKGVELEEPKVKPEAKAVFLRQTDPAGNRVHLIWRA